MSLLVRSLIVTSLLIVWQLTSLLLGSKGLARNALTDSDDLHGKSMHKPVRPKIFGLGLSKTGTTSMSVALAKLGYRSIHNDASLTSFMYNPNATVDLTGKYDDVDAVFDIPTAAYFRELHAAYPDAKFILTVRSSPTEWYQSFKTYLGSFLYYKWGCAVPERVQRLHDYVYGSRNIQDSWIDAYEDHVADVEAYFHEHAPENLITMNLSNENPDPWHKLCAFLEVTDGPCSDKPTSIEFPRSNSASDHQNISNICPGDSMTKDLVSLEEAPGNISTFAYVALLCHPSGPNQVQYIRMLIVLMENIREFDTKNDIVVMVYGGINKIIWNTLSNLGFKIVRVSSVSVRQDLNFINQPDEHAAKCYRSKLRALQLVAYDKIMFVDLDLLFEKDVREFFHREGFTIGTGYLSPMNAGFFVAKPSHQAFTDIADIARSGTFTEETGWMDYGFFPHWRLENETSDWSFWGSTVDQGLLFYYYGLLMQNTTNIMSVEYTKPLYTHFAGENKPFLHHPDNADKKLPKRYVEPVRKWYLLWNNVKHKLSSDQIAWFESVSSMKQS
mmetsp:Transcript_23317/g.47302  ORF Transcript_23317/g.47302 Transcript_23317/m.47302 type:complete len:557 (-) Transcript_23317:49-1719(-)|eukprot:CAMPEP_0183307836 /NCGR_PEP_ID=MMETSP0160_2-20130417/19577_1 /TAXON_ID=2839 ORGANISM="Odontella Sinensis, Strain Grunow 1884" /NCGR_SAMPLE_ID=MMETSP0160_2 /ASSEMBLY_ACC=CAM_ASM_000250 /LENGTH=556 /DNA_ID=CAMNT_0025471527 /DNA_START=88 /DNA_END=1758 /DNA_ORIENTATION=-